MCVRRHRDSSMSIISLKMVGQSWECPPNAQRQCHWPLSLCLQFALILYIFHIQLCMPRCVAASTCGTQTIVWHLSHRAWAELKKRDWIEEWECYMNWGGMPDQAKPRHSPNHSPSPAQQCKSRISLAVAGNRPERSRSLYLGVEAFLIFNQL